MRADPEGTDLVRLTMPLGQSTQGSSGSFLGRCSDGQRRWIKPLNNCQNTPMVTINEYIVGRLGALIHAPVCQVSVVQISADHAGWEFRAGHRLEVGLANGSLEVPNSHEDRALGHRTRDDNARRHVGVFAMYDWCWGSDPQWLFETPADERLHSHDHGHYFPAGPAWSAATVQPEVGNPHPLGQDAAGLDRAAIDQMADRIAHIDGSGIVAVLATVPRSWPVSDDDLAALGQFLEDRVDGVATRLRRL